MNIHEYQAKKLFKEYGVAVPEGYPAMSVAEALDGAKKLAGPVYAVKAQIHAGGRGKGGGVKVVHSLEDVEEQAKAILGMQLVTPQTGPAGKKVNRIYIEQGSEKEKEFYLSIVVDRKVGRVSFIVSTEGGMDIEEVAHKTPEKIITLNIDPVTGFKSFHGREIAFALGLKGDLVKQCVKFTANLYTLFVQKDASLIEINPLVVTKDGQLMCLDAKCNFDSNALFRHPEIEALRDKDEEDPLETHADEFDLNYIKLDGKIGCMVNGAGLAMATMDIIKLYGEDPANFLDVGGGATTERVTEAFKIIMSDPDVKGVLVNIFGGIMRCDVIAQGIVVAAEQVKISVPLVVRLEGTNAEKGREIINNSAMNCIAASDLGDAAKRIVEAVE